MIVTKAVSSACQTQETIDSRATNSSGTGESWVARTIVDVDWRLYSVPETAFIKNKMVLSTRIGKWLNNHGCFNVSLVVCIAVQLLLSVLAPVNSLAGTSKLIGIPQSIRILAHVVIAVCLSFFILHRCNRDIFSRVIRSAAFVIVFSLLVLAHLAEVVASIFLRENASSDPIQTIVGNAILIAFRTPLLLLAASTDSLFTTRSARLAIVLLLCACALWAWLDARCISESWGVRPMCGLFDAEGFSPQESYLHTLSQSFPLCLTGLLRIASGKYFSYVCPKFSPLACDTIGDGGGEDSGVWYSCEPSDLNVKRKMILCTPVGNFLERWGLMKSVLLLSTLAHFLIFFAHGSLFFHISKNEGSYVLSIKPGREAMYTCVVVSMWWLDFLLLHYMNRQVFILCLKRFEVSMVAGSVMVAISISAVNILMTFGDRYWPLRLLLLLGQWLLAIILASYDALSFSRCVKLSLITLVNIALIWIYLEDRCLSNRWKTEGHCEELLSGHHAHKSPRELYLNCVLGAFVLYVRAVYAHLTGRSFSVWSPSYMPASSGVVSQMYDAKADHSSRAHPEPKKDHHIDGIKAFNSRDHLDDLQPPEEPHASGDCKLLKLFL